MIHRNAIMMIRLSVTAASLINIGIAAPASEAADSSKSFLRTPKHGGVYVVAHRGAHNGIPENSLAAYRKAIELGVDFVEIDIRATKDGNQKLRREVPCGRRHRHRGRKRSKLLG